VGIMSRHKTNRYSQWSDRIECVSLTSFRSDFSFVATVLQYSGIRMHHARSVEEADFLLTVTGGTVFLSDATFAEGTWRDAMQMGADFHPLVAFSIVAEPVDWEFVSGAFGCGACGVLWKPIDISEAIAAIRLADQATRDRSIVLNEAPISQVLLSR
jgi:DNA-binding NtrC family response regulator